VCAKPKQQRYFEVLHVPTGEHVAIDIPEWKLSDCIEQLLVDGLVLRDLKITQEYILKQIWTIDE
jgi:hypothetical protein